MSSVAIDDVVDRISDVTWFHTFDLGNGQRTDGSINTPKVIHRIGLPENLSGKSVLDVGAWDGYYSFEAERRGAKRVLATDNFCWSGPGWGTKQGFDLMHRRLDSKVASQDIDVMDLSPDSVGTFDVVMFLGVLYHLRHPMAALERIASVTQGQLILETATDMNHVRKPAMAFYQGQQLNNDSTNWFGPNEAAIHAMLRAVGFNRIETVYRPRFGYALKSLARRITGRPEGGRIAVHAWK